MTAPLASVVLGAYNEERLVGEAIRSVLAQTLGDFELVVVDDGSADGTAAVVEGLARQDSRVRLVQHERNRGFANALNTGIGNATAEYVAMIDADDLWMPGYLERMTAALAARPDAGFAFTDAWWLDDTSGRFHRRTTSESLGAPASPPDSPAELLDSIIPSNWIFGLATMRRSALEELGGFDAGLPACEDYDLWIRMLRAGFAGVFAGPKLAIQRDRRGSMSTVQHSMFDNLIRVLEPVARADDLPEHTRALAASRISELEGWRGALDSPGSRTALKQRIRSAAGRARKRALPGLVWRSSPPPGVPEAFPGLGGD